GQVRGVPRCDVRARPARCREHRESGAGGCARHGGGAAFRRIGRSLPRTGEEHGACRQARVLGDAELGDRRPRAPGGDRLRRVAGRGRRSARLVIRAAPVLALLLAVAQPALAETREEEAAAALAALQQSDARLLAVGWRLATGNAAYCSDPRPAVGLLLQDTAG